jgi:hypothetical protein
MYVIIPLLHEFKSELRDGNRFTKAVVIIVHAVRLVAGFSSQPVPLQNLEQAGKLFRDFLHEMIAMFGDEYASYKHHNIVHFVEDMRTFECHLDRNSAYTYENFHRGYKSYIQPGPKPLLQLV